MPRLLLFLRRAASTHGAHAPRSPHYPSRAMIHPSPTTKIDPAIARGVLERVQPAHTPEPAHVVISFPNTSYQTALVLRAGKGSETDAGALQARIGKRILGRIWLSARRVDVVDTGGRYLEPVFGRPRRVQGSVIARLDDQRTIIVDAGVPIHCRLTDERQRPEDFEIGALVSFDALDGASFTPQM